MSETYYTLRGDAPMWARETWPLEDPMPVDDLTLADAYEDPADDCDRDAAWERVKKVRPYLDQWDLVASIDHGARCADETMALECAYVGELVMVPVLVMMTGRSFAWVAGQVDAWAAVVDAVGDWDGAGWVEPTADDLGAERVHWVHEDIVRYATWGHVDGVMWDSSGDVGMAWFYVRQDGR